MNIEISEEQKEWLIKLQKEYFTQDNRGTRTPIYEVQTKTKMTCDEQCDSSGFWLIDDNGEEIISINNNQEDYAARTEELEEAIFSSYGLDKGDETEKCKDVQKNIDSYWEENSVDIFYADVADELVKFLESVGKFKDIRVCNFQYVWETRAICFTEQEAKNYQINQSHNLGISRTYATSPGYTNYGHFSKLHGFVRDLRLLDDEGEVQLCRLGILNRMLRDEEKVKIEDIITCTNEIKTIVSIKRYSNEEEGKKDHIVFKDTNGENHYLYDIELNSLIRIRNYFYNN